MNARTRTGGGAFSSIGRGFPVKREGRHRRRPFRMRTIPLIVLFDAKLAVLEHEPRVGWKRVVPIGQNARSLIRMRGEQADQVLFPLRPGAARVARRLAAHLAVEFPAVFTFILEPTRSTPRTGAPEHALRPAVVTRNVLRGQPI